MLTQKPFGAWCNGEWYGKRTTKKEHNEQTDMTVVCGALCIAMAGCGKSDRDRYIEAMSEVIPETNKEEITKGTEHFDSLPSAEEKCKAADYAEYFAYLKRTTGGDMREIKKKVSKTFEGMSADARRNILKKCR